MALEFDYIDDFMYYVCECFLRAVLKYINCWKQLNNKCKIVLAIK